MTLSRREFVQLLAAAGAAGFTLNGCASSTGSSSAGANAATGGASDPYAMEPFGNVSLLHYTDCHAQLLPIHFREPHINIGVGAATGQPPHLTGNDLLQHFNIGSGTAEAYALTHLGFSEAAKKYGKVGGFAHLSSLVQRIRTERPGRTLLLDGGDAWQGSGTALWTKGQDMVDAQKLLGVDIMTGHWEFTHGAERVTHLVENDLKGSIEFLAQNVRDTAWGEAVFKPYVIREMNGVQVAIIGQAFPYTPVANPRHMVEEWSFGIQEARMQKTVDEARGKGAQVVALLSHNGMDVDLKLASRVTGIDAILGGHTHDGVPKAIEVKNSSGTTLVMNSGSNAKFLSVLDLEVKGGKVTDYRFKLMPIFSNLLPADPAMSAYIDKVRAPYKAKLEEKLAVTEGLLYRRGNFNGSFDQLILDALLERMDAEIAFSPGFRWGVSLLPGATITMDDLLTQTAITYGATTLNQVTGEQIKVILEDVADNLYNEDPYYQQGGDMVRTGGLKYSIDIHQKQGKRIGDMELGGKPIDPARKYKIAGWASVNPQPDDKPRVWDVVADYMRDKKVIAQTEPNVPKMR